MADRSDPARPRLVLCDERTGRVLRGFAAPGLAGAGTWLGADARGPVYVRTGPSAPGYSVLRLARGGG